MKLMGDVVAEPAKSSESGGIDECDDAGVRVRRASLDSADRLSLASTTTSGSSGLSGGAELGTRTLRSLKRGLGKLWRRHRGNASITEYDPSYKVAYLGNVLTGWAKGEGCVEKPVSTLWRNYVSSSRPDVSMRLTVTSGGLTATTKDHGLTEYWAHRVTYCTAPASHPRLFVWVYRHEGRRLRPELRCHAALCSKESTARRLASVLNARLHQALLEFRRDKVSRQNARLSLANAVYENPSLPRRKLLLSTGGSNYRPPLERSKSAPKLSAIEEDAVAEEIEQQRFLEELRSLERVARTWQEQEGWRLARLLDSLHRESSDENGSISSGCETASTTNSEERVSSSEDSHLPAEADQLIAGAGELLSSFRASCPAGPTEAIAAATTTNPVAVPVASGPGPRRNSDGSPNFMTCAGSPRFRRRCSRQQRGRSRRLSTLARLESDEAMEDEDEDARIEEGVSVASTGLFDFEDLEDLDEIVDFRPHGEIATRLQTDAYAALMARREDVLKLMGSRRLCSSRDEIDARGSDEAAPALVACSPAIPELTTAPATTGTVIPSLGSLDEEADSDESGYVEASPKNSMERPSSAEAPLGKPIEQAADFIRCPISETIKKLANASLRSNKSAKAPGCHDVLANKPAAHMDGESPSLLQRKRLLAQHGVTV